jgi:hypothetical protein
MIQPSDWPSKRFFVGVLAFWVVVIAAVATFTLVAGPAHELEKPNVESARKHDEAITSATPGSSRLSLESARKHEEAITQAEIAEHPGRAMVGDTATVWAQMQADGLAFQARLHARLERELSPEEKELLNLGK